MTDQTISQRAHFLRALAHEAGQMALDAFHNRAAGHYELKGIQDPVTEADRAVEAHIRKQIAERFPDDGFLGEESGLFQRDSDCGVWVVDPIDGTDNFARGIPHFCVSIAWVQSGRVVLAAISNPSTDELYLAELGQGATKNGLPISVSGTPDITMAAIELGWSRRVDRADYLAMLNGLLDRGANVRRCGSGALALAWVAEGRTDGYAELHMNSWDSLAGLLLVKEAGGVISMPTAGAALLQKGGLVYAANPSIASALIETVPVERAA